MVTSVLLDAGGVVQVEGGGLQTGADGVETLVERGAGLAV